MTFKQLLLMTVTCHIIMTTMAAKDRERGTKLGTKSPILEDQSASKPHFNYKGAVKGKSNQIKGELERLEDHIKPRHTLFYGGKFKGEFEALLFHHELNIIDIDIITISKREGFLMYE